MTHAVRRQISWLAVCVLVPAAGAWAVQAPHVLPPTHERQCVATGDVAAGSSRRVTVTWMRPFATAEYAVIGSVSDSTDADRSLELGHVVAPYTPTATAAVVFNRDTRAAHSGIVCLDAIVESDTALGRSR
jgi:hypothetical protein